MTTESFEKKTWRTSSGVWRWRVRITSAGRSFASGVTETRALADDAITAAIAARDVEMRTPWKRVSA
jgi:hypothetical protein